MHTLALLCTLLVGGPLYEGNAQFEAAEALAIRQRRPLVVFMGDVLPVKEETDIWIAAYKPMPFGSVNVYVPGRGSHLEYAGTTLNVDDVRRIIREQIELRGHKNHVPTPPFDWGVEVLKIFPRKLPVGP